MRKRIRLKKHIRRGDPQRQAYWNALFRRWREGGQSVRGFCRTEGLWESAFYFWRRRSARPGRAEKGAKGSRLQGRPVTRARRTTKVLRQGDPTPSFLPVQVVDAGKEGVGDKAAWGVEIVLAAGRSVRVAPGFHRQTLLDVLAVLEGLSC